MLDFTAAVFTFFGYSISLQLLPRSRPRMRAFDQPFWLPHAVLSALLLHLLCPCKRGWNMFVWSLFVCYIIYNVGIVPVFLCSKNDCRISLLISDQVCLFFCAAVRYMVVLKEENINTHNVGRKKSVRSCSMATSSFTLAASKLWKGGNWQAVINCTQIDMNWTKRVGTVR